MTWAAPIAIASPVWIIAVSVAVPAIAVLCAAVVYLRVLMLREERDDNEHKHHQKTMGSAENGFQNADFKLRFCLPSTLSTDKKTRSVQTIWRYRRRNPDVQQEQPIAVTAETRQARGSWNVGKVSATAGLVFTSGDNTMLATFPGLEELEAGMFRGMTPLQKRLCLEAAEQTLVTPRGVKELSWNRRQRSVRRQGSFFSMANSRAEASAASASAGVLRSTTNSASVTPLATPRIGTPRSTSHAVSRHTGLTGDSPLATARSLETPRSLATPRSLGGVRVDSLRSPAAIGLMPTGTPRGA